MGAGGTRRAGLMIGVRTRAKKEAAVAAVLMADPGGRHFGYDTCRKAGVGPGTMHPALVRWERAGWLASGWEDDGVTDRRGRPRPRRRWYTVTEAGQAGLGALLAGSRTAARE